MPRYTLTYRITFRPGGRTPALERVREFGSLKDLEAYQVKLTSYVQKNPGATVDIEVVEAPDGT